MPSSLFNQDKSSLILNSFHLYMAHFADYLLALLFIPFIARTIGAVEFGVIGVIQTFGIFIILFIEFGSSLFATRKISRIKTNVKQLRLFIGEFTVFKISLTPIAIILTVFALLAIPIFNQNLIYVIIVFFGAIFQGLTPIWYFQGIEKMKKIALSKFFFRLLGFIIILLFVRDSSDGWIVLTSFSLSSILICLFLYYSMIKSIGYIKIQISKKIFKIFLESFSSFFVTIAPVFYQNISIFVLSIYANPIELGLYFGANRIHRAFNTLFGPMNQAFFPILSSIKNKDEIKKEELIKEYFWLIFTVGLLFSFLIFAFAEEIILLVLGSEFLKSAEILIILGMVLPLTALSNVLGRQWLIISNRDYSFALTQLCSCIIALLFFLFFVSKIGVKALPLSLILYEISSILIMFVIIIKK